MEEASRIVLRNCTLAIKESVLIEKAQGRTLAEDIHADRDFPPFNRVTMDGIAINHKAFVQGIRRFTVEGVAAAGSPLIRMNNKDACIEVMTGAMLPNNCDTVIRYEDLEIEKGIALVNLSEVRYQQNVHFQGSDRAENSLLIKAGKQIGPPELGVLATCGKACVQVYKTPRIAIVSSGDELVNVDQEPLPHQIRKSNNYSIAGALQPFNCAITSFHLRDDPAEIHKELGLILEKFDVIILSGGVSMGKFDYIPEALNKLGVKKLFHKVAQRPGKPFWFGKSEEAKIVFALPGNPVSSFMCTNKYVLSWVRKHLGISEAPIYAALTTGIEFKPDLTYFAQVQVSYTTKGKITATPIEGNGSGDLANLTDADGFLELPRGSQNYLKGHVYPLYTF